MDIFTLAFWAAAIISITVSLIKDKNKTKQAAIRSRKMMGGILGEILGIIFLIGLVITFIPTDVIKKTLGSSNDILATAVAAVVGSITLIPAFIAFPFVGSLVDIGSSIVPAAAFLTTLTMVGAVTFSLEKKEFGMKFALSRNILSFGAAVVIAMVMGVII